MTTQQSQNFILTIPKQAMSQLPPAHFHGSEIVVIDKPENVSDAISSLLSADILGFDTETRPSFKKGQTHIVSLLQLSTREKCFLFRLNRIGLPQELKDLLENRNQLKIGLSLHDDFHNLNKLAPVAPDGFIDLQQYVKNFKIADNSLTRIYGILFGHRISKGQRLTNWEAAELSPAQQAYAALDAMACIDIYDLLSQGRFSPYHSPYKVFPEETATE